MLALAGKLPPITERQRSWAFRHCFTPRAIYWPRKHEVRCLCCGQTAVWDKPFIESFVDVDQYDCPYCDRTTTIERYSRETTITREHELFTIITTFRGIQVARTFEVSRCNYRNDHFARYDINEVYQNWLLDNGKEIITGRQLHRSPLCTTWDFHLPLTILHHNASTTGQYAFSDMYDISGHFIYPDVRVTPLIRRNGWTCHLRHHSSRISLIEAMRWLLTVPTAEMLVKTGQFELFYNMVRREKKELPNLHSVRIANRNHYIVTDAQMWPDMLSMADDLGLDTHNPLIVCPDNLQEAHDCILRRFTRLQEKKRAAERLKSMKQWEEKYRASKARFFGICFGNDDIVITVIQSVADMADEGKAMHHCVFSAGYYKRDDCLILSARDREGRRIETIELSLKTFKVEQSRGRFNTTTPRHDEILALIDANINLIRQAATSAA